MKILLTADPELPVPPKLYGGIERIVDMLAKEYTSAGHDVTLIAHRESATAGRLVAWNREKSGGLGNTIVNSTTLAKTVLANRFDVVHSFSRLAYLTPILPLSVLKVMSYQREPTLKQIRKARRFAKKSSLYFTGCSDYITDQIKPHAAAATVYNGVSLQNFDFSSGVSSDAPLSFLGRIEPIKGTHLAIEVAQKSGRRLVIAGNIPKEGEAYFNEKIKPHLNGQIEYIGPVNDHQKNLLLTESAGFLMPIQWNEPFGIVMAEAMACGTPVIGFPFGSVPEVVKDGINGFVCKSTDEMVLAVSKISLLDRRQVRNYAESHFSEKRIANAYLKIYERLA